MYSIAATTATKVIGVPAAALARRVEHRLQQVPLLIDQITWIRRAPHGVDLTSLMSPQSPRSSRAVMTDPW